MIWGVNIMYPTIEELDKRKKMVNFQIEAISKDLDNAKKGLSKLETEKEVIMVLRRLHNDRQ